MRHELNFWVVGGDMRQAKLAEQLSDDGHTVHTYALDRAPEPVPDPQDSLEDAVLADCVILPLPAAGEGGCSTPPCRVGRPPWRRLWTPCGRGRWSARAG